MRVVEFADLQCPFCREFALSPTFKSIVDGPVRGGEVRMEFRTLTFIGPDSGTAARLAEAAGRQDRLWQVVEQLYARQGTENSGWVTKALQAKVLAAVPGLDAAKVNAEADTAAVTSQLKAAQALATSSKVELHAELPRRPRRLAEARRRRGPGRRRQGGHRAAMSDRLRAAAIACCVLGLGIAGYLTYVHYAGVTPACEIAHGCEKVQTSEWSELAGVPVALLGLLTYVGILAALLGRGETALLAAAGLSLVGFGFSAYLTYREVFTIEAICIWCVGSAILMTALAALTVARLVRAPGAPGAPSERGLLPYVG